MEVNRICNFNAGPAALPEPVLQELQANVLNFQDCCMSILEISHRSSDFDNVINDAVARTKRLLGIGEDYHVLFLQGGASLQFAMIPMNFLAEGRTADYINTGTWSTKAIKEAQIQKKNFNVAASSEDRNFAYIPKQLSLNPDATFVHITSNNTIKGTQWDHFPDTGNVPLVADMSSDFMCRPIDMSKFGMIYVGAQKNIGPAGVCMVIVRDDMLKLIPDGLPTMLDYRTHVEKNSMYNTPPCFAIYTVQLVLKWLEETVGGLGEMEKINRKKAELLYSAFDESDFYKGTADLDSRSMMNVTFRLPSEELEKKFIDEAAQNGLGGLKGHRSVGGCRASIYNATTVENVEKLISFMKEFENKNK
ncbi:MAG: 3-phosphoserine/phosphohydroxythreonine transaminase [Desulfosalsimonas sp.]|uniref:3-phosphoserine/phosphohydroxythreonine transaminase n=1 Tax=Desulfosalsimonas sp. TaxID=3073848 RepID=UPI003970DED2